MKTDESTPSLTENDPIGSKVHQLTQEYSQEFNRYRLQKARDPLGFIWSIGLLIIVLFQAAAGALPVQLVDILTIPMLAIAAITLSAGATSFVRTMINLEKRALVTKLMHVKSALEAKQETMLLPLLDNTINKIKFFVSYEYALGMVEIMLLDFNIERHIARMNQSDQLHIQELSALMGIEFKAKLISQDIESLQPNDSSATLEILQLFSFNVKAEPITPEQTPKTSSFSIMTTLFSSEKPASMLQLKVDPSLMDLPIAPPAKELIHEAPSSISFFGRMNQAVKSLRNAVTFTPNYPQVPKDDLNDENETPLIDDETRRLLTGEDEPRRALSA